jgi:uncharacterized tellurite resistance protein B-like protein
MSAGASPAASSRASSFWVPEGQSSAIQGFAIPRGQFYIGRGLPAIADAGVVEPALIDPALPIDRAAPDRAGALMGYWPSYATIDPRCRAAYLEWLAGGRVEPQVSIGYVFLFLYGLERRFFFDSVTTTLESTEIKGIRTEIERLIDIFGSHNSFRTYAENFLSVATALGLEHPAYLLEPPSVRRWGPPLLTRLALGQLADEGKPLPVAWALNWVLSHRETNVRRPALRCPDELAECFRLRYAAKFGTGLPLKPGKRPIEVEHRPASASFGGPITIRLPNVNEITAPARTLHFLQGLLEECMIDLESYSRWVGRNPSLGSSLAAVSLLPAELVPHRLGKEGAALVESLRQEMAGVEMKTIETKTLLRHWPGDETGKASKRAGAVMFSQLLERLGYGIEPDIRFGGPRLSMAAKVVTFRLQAGSPSVASPDYSAATLLLQLATMVSLADGQILQTEEEQMRAHVESAFALSCADRLRLTAHTQWLLADPPSTAGVRKRVVSLPDTARVSIAHFLVSVAGVDGHITPEEIRVLTKICDLIGLDSNEIFAWIHALGTGTMPSVEPVTVRPARPAPTAHRIPAPPELGEVRLDMAKVQATMAETSAVSSLLTAVLTSDDSAEPPTAEPAPSGIARMDAAHSKLFASLAERPQWTRAEFEAMASSVNLMPDGAMENMNEAAFDLVGEPAFEGLDPIEVNKHAVQEMLA